MKLQFLFVAGSALFLFSSCDSSIDGGIPAPLDIPEIVVTPSRISIDETGSMGFAVALPGQPAADVVVTISSPDLSLLTLVPDTLTFTPDDFVVPQYVTLQTFADDDFVDNQLELVVHTETLTDVTVVVNILDVDKPRVIISPRFLSLRESGADDMFVRLLQPPAGAVTVSFALDVAGKIIMTPASMQFTPADYGVVQIIHVTPIADGNPEDEKIILSATTPDLPDEQAVIYVVDNDKMSVSTVGVNVIEEGSSAPIGVHLNVQPLYNEAYVRALSVDRVANPRLQYAPSLLSYTAANYDTDQNVAVSGLSDDDLLDNTVELQFFLSSETKPLHSTFVHIQDDDVQTIVVGNAVSVPENGSTTFTIRLGFQPTQSVQIEAVLDTDVATISPSEIIFSPADWDQDHSVTIYGTFDFNLSTNTTTMIWVTDSAVTGRDAAAPVNVQVTVPDTAG